MQIAKPFRLAVLAIGEWLLVLPAAVFLASVALHLLLQPRQYQPAHASWIIFEWTTTHISRLGAAMLFNGTYLETLRNIQFLAADVYLSGRLFAELSPCALS